MPAIGGGHALLKWVTSFPGNPALGLPTVTGLVILSNAETGQLEAVLDAASVTALRTAAAGVLAADDASARDDASSVAVVGMRGERRRDGSHARRTRTDAARVGRRRRATPRRGGSSSAQTVAGSLDEALGCDTVITVTPGRQRPLPRPARCAPGQHVSLMGADGPGKAEVAAAELVRARALLRRLGAGEPRRRARRRGRGRHPRRATM